MPRGKKNNNKNNGGQRKKREVKTIVVKAAPQKGHGKMGSKGRRNGPKKGNRGQHNVTSLPGAFSVQGSAMYAQQSMTLSGCDYLATVNCSALNDSVVMQSFLLNPQRMIPGSRLATFGAMWDKFSFQYLELIYEPSVSTTTSGSIMLSADPDVLDDYTGQKGNLLLQKLSSTAHNVSVPVYGPVRLRINDKRFFKRDLFTEPETLSDPRNSYSGRVWLASCGGLAAGTYGRLYLKWKVNFSCPNIDEEFEEGTAMIAAFTGPYITSTYPWGDFSTIITDFPTANAYLPADFCTFTSDAVLGSVITFQSAGFYLVTMKRSGVAMGTGAFSGVNFSAGISNSLPANDTGFGSGVDFYIANGTSTASQWTILVNVTISGATMSATNDTGVTHTYGFVAVSRFDMTKGNSSSLGAVEVPVSKTDFARQMESMKNDFERKLALMSKPRVGLGVPNLEQTYDSVLLEDETETKAPAMSFTQVGTSVTTQILPLEVIPPLEGKSPRQIAPEGYVWVNSPRGGKRLLSKTEY